MANVREYTVGEWAEFDGLTVEEEIEDFACVHGNPVKFFGSEDEEAAVAGVQYEDGTFGAFGAGMEFVGITKEMMYDAIEAGF